MNLTDLGYSEKWLEYGILDEEILQLQFLEFQKGEDQNTEHYRYATFLNWLKQKDTFSDLEVEHFIALTLVDADKTMAGTALKELFTSSKISPAQFDFIKTKLPLFGDWTIKLINREELKKKINEGTLTKETFYQCVEHAKKFKDNILIELCIEITENTNLLLVLTSPDFGKKISTLANAKLCLINK